MLLTVQGDICGDKGNSTMQLSSTTCSCFQTQFFLIIFFIFFIFTLAHLFSVIKKIVIFFKDLCLFLNCFFCYFFSFLKKIFFSFFGTVT